MVFTSPLFLFAFLPLSIVIHYCLRPELRNAFLFLASSLFYYYGEQKMLLLLYLVIFVNYLTALALDFCRSRSWPRRELYAQALLCACVFFSIALLWYFKYWNFTLRGFNALAALAGLTYRVTHFDKIVLPLGISFYTFHLLSYTLDVYRQKMPAEKNLLNLAAYVLMFPQLVAGPIVRYIDIKKQFLERTVTALGAANGLRRFCFGLAKKVLIANTLAKAADKIFALDAGTLGCAAAWLGALCYTMQIYYDFSGYSDMAIGLARLFGFHYKENFNYPYISRSVSEFWQRWHISLSTWLRDYVYFSVGGSRVSLMRFCGNALLVFFLSGLWHGAHFTFIVWGLWYGVFLILERCFLKGFLVKHRLLAHLYALAIIVFGWVIFRAVSVKYAGKFWAAMLGAHGLQLDALWRYTPNDILAALFFACLFSYDWRSGYKKFVSAASTSRSRFAFFKALSYLAAVALFLVALASIMANTYNPFIYFRF